MDKLDSRSRSNNMRQIRSENTKPELLLRSALHKQGFRFRIHLKDLPGKPDIVFPGRRRVIFVHGYFWHQHPNCREGRIPKSRREYWEPKLRGNQQRDLQARHALKAEDWQVIIVWECELKNLDSINARLHQIFGCK